MNKPLVSILIPVYNVESYIARCIDSILGQTYRNLEVVFVDDCSPDHSMDVAHRTIDASTQGKDIRFVYLRHQQNQGIAIARNTLIENATGDFVTFLDPDDWLTPDAVEVMVNRQVETDADIVSAKAVRHLKNSDILLEDPVCVDKKDMVLAMLEPSLVHILVRRLIRRTLFVDNNIRAVDGINIGEDWVLMPKLAYCAKRFAVIDHVVYHYDNTRENSYTTRSGDYVFYRGRQAGKCLDCLNEYFEDKDTVFVERIAQISVFVCYGQLLTGVDYRNESFFKEFLARLNNIRSASALALIGWNNPLKKFIDSFYFLWLLRRHLSALKKL